MREYISATPVFDLIVGDTLNNISSKLYTPYNDGGYDKLKAKNEANNVSTETDTFEPGMKMGTASTITNRSLSFPPMRKKLKTAPTATENGPHECVN
uniref:Uncharacterized protein n=1 Tax=Plectus sambesii TaxID=2011161 RepID=A0A914W5A0_9BILA